MTRIMYRCGEALVAFAIVFMPFWMTAVLILVQKWSN